LGEEKVGGGLGKMRGGGYHMCLSCGLGHDERME